MRSFKNQLLSRKGVVLVLVVAAVAVMLIMTVAMARLGFQSRVFAIRTTQELMARAAADAGHDRAVFELNCLTSAWTGDLPYPDPDPAPLPGTNQTYTYTISQPDPAPAGLEAYIPYVYNIEATGWSGTVSPKTRKVYSTVILTNSFDFGLFVNTTLEIKNGGIVDAYDSSLPYGENNSGEPVRIGTNSGGFGMVTLKLGIEIAPESTIHVGPLDEEDGVMSARDVLTGLGAASIPEGYVLGPSAPVTLELWQMSNDPPGDTESAGKLTKTKSLDPNSTHVYKGISLGNNDKLTIAGPGVKIKVGSGGVNLEPGSTLTIDDGASVVFYMDGDFIAKKGSYIYNYGVPADLKIFGAEGCKEVIIHNDGDFSGVVYAANAALDIKNSGDVFGSFSGDSAVIRNSGGFHYDESLKSGNPGDLGTRFTVVRWREE